MQGYSQRESQLSHAHYLQAVEGLELEQSVHLEADVDEPFLLAETRHILQLTEQDNVE